MRAKTVNEGWFSKNKIPNDNIKILQLIYDEFDLKYHEGDFNPKTWIRKGDLLPDENKNDEIITDFAGISISFDSKNLDYTLSLPVKFNSEFKLEVEKLLKTLDYDITDVKTTKYTCVIKFK